MEVQKLFHVIIEIIIKYSSRQTLNMQAIRIE